MTQTPTSTTKPHRIIRSLQHIMAPQLAPSQREQIHAMLLHELPKNEIAKTVDCSERAVRRIRSRLRQYGTTTSPSNRVGRERKITPLMRDALFERLAKQPDMFRDEMIRFLHDRFDLEVSRMLKTEGWSRKTNGRVAKQRNPDLRELYLYKLSDCRSYQLVFIDESGRDKRSGHRRQGWAPSGATPVQVDEFNLQGDNATGRRKDATDYKTRRRYGSTTCGKGRTARRTGSLGSDHCLEGSLQPHAVHRASMPRNILLAGPRQPEALQTRY